MTSKQRGGHIQTFYVRGTDGRFYGPAGLSELNHWATDGRILADTVLVENGTDRQVLARDLPGLAHHFQLAPRPPGTPAPPPSGSWSSPPAPSAQPYTPGPALADGYVRKSKLAAGLLAFFLGWAGAHRFYLGYTAVGLIMLTVSLLSIFVCGVGLVVTFVWGFIEFVLVLMDQLPDSNGARLD